MITVDIGGSWLVKQADTDEQIPANVPGDIYADLLREGKIPDPFYRNNEEQLQWIGETDWLYSREFTIDNSLFEHDLIMLCCDGLDTFAKITLNGKTIAQTDNMFRSYEWDVKSILVPGKNSIEIYFASTIPYAQKKQKKHYLPCWGVDAAGYDENWVMHKPHKVNIAHGWIRKEQCNYGWDWGLMAVTCGIWKDIKLTAFNSARINNVHIRQQHTDNKVTLSTDITLESVSNEKISAKITLSYENIIIENKKVDISGNSEHTEIVLEEPNLWWPAGMGNQHLYDVNIELMDSNNIKIDSTYKRIGLRTVNLERKKDKWGQSFHFAVNGLPFFTKGANWIPTDGILANIPKTRYYTLLKAATEANMNMIRVWGGGIYEPDIFYDICDELGLLVWQDFMFACSTYPTYDDDFIKTVEAELHDNIKRLRHHTCIALWCGNNELEQGLAGDEWTDKTMCWKDYSRLFDEIMPNIVNELDPDTDYWPCSPHTPLGDRTEFNNPTCGDSHLWDVWHGKKPFEWYRTTNHRFVSEFGFQSFTEPKTTNYFTVPEDRNVTSYIMEHHQRSDIGNSTIMHYMLDWFRIPLGFENTIWVSQIQQGMAIKYAVEHWRRNMPESMGAIYWQLNDTWPGPSWSSIDYFCRWKALHYIAKKFYEPIMISGVEIQETKEVEIHITNDLHEKSPVKVICEVTDLSGNILYADTFETETLPHGNKNTASICLKNIIEKNGTRNILVWLELHKDNKTVSTNFVNFEKPKYLELKNPNIKTDISIIDTDSFNIVLTANSPALWTWLELKNIDAQFSDNFFHLRTGRPLEIRVKPNSSLKIEEFKKQLIVKSLVDTY